MYASTKIYLIRRVHEEKSSERMVDMSDREEKFEKMLEDIQQNYSDIIQKMEKLKEENKTKSATYRQLMGNKLNYQNMLSMYKLYGLIEIL